MTRFLSFTITAILGISSCTSAEPFHIFEFDVPAGYTETDTSIVQEHFFSKGEVSAKVIITTCKKHETFGSGLRVDISNRDKNRGLLFGLVCDSNTNELFAGWLVMKGTGDDRSVANSHRVPLKRSVGEEVNLTMQLQDRIITFQLEDVIFTRYLSFEPVEAKFFGFGTDGSVQFYRKQPNN
ncbi:MAG: hypothetical protein COA60_002640 [Robiginitomaculum sp.]|nr:hypothetical protein [Robiginitomaculum sp.]